MEVEVAVMMQPQAKECWQPPEESRNRLSPRVPGRSVSLVMPRFWSFGFQNWEQLNFCCSKPAGLGKFVAAAEENEYTHDVDITIVHISQMRKQSLRKEGRDAQD